MRLTAREFDLLCVPRAQPAPGLLARPADGPRLGLRGRARHGHRDRPHPPAAREDRGRSRPSRATSRRSGASATGSCRDRGRAPPRRRDARRRARRRVRAAAAADACGFSSPALRCSRSCCRSPPSLASGLGDVPHGRRREDPRPSRPRSAPPAVVAALLLARWIPAARPPRRASAQQLAAGDLTRAGARGRPARARRARAPLQRDGGSSLEQLFDARRQLVAWASHDLRTPLASMQAMLEAIDDGLAEPDEYLPALHDQVRTLAGLVDDLFELARIDAGALTLELARDVARAARRVDVCGARGRGARARTIAARAELDGEASRASLRAGQDRARALQPAHERAPAHAVRRLGRGPRPAAREDVVVAVEDTGEGLGRGRDARMFDRFWRGDAPRHADGSGPRARDRARPRRGSGRPHLGREPPPGGTRVSFTLPLAAT